MKNLQDIPRLIHFIFLFSIPYVITIVAQTPPYKPDEDITLNCGSSHTREAKDGRIWFADDGVNDPRFSLVEKEDSKSITSTARSQDSSDDDVPYKTARMSRSQFTYSFPVKPGPKFIRLHFHSTPYDQDFEVSKAIFTVRLEGSFTLLKNFGAYIFAEYYKKPAFKKEFCIMVEESQRSIDLTFVPVASSYAFVNGIEIVSMPAKLYYTPGDDPSKSPPLIGQRYSYGDYSKKALETLYRLNVGGSDIYPKEDTGMYREWSQDRPYLKSDGVFESDVRIPLKYSKIPNDTAPDDVYLTALSMGPNGTKNSITNLTWSLPIDSGFHYLVRLHFCEFQEIYSGPTDMVFIIYIDNQTAENAANIVSWTGGRGNGIPVYKDYVVNIMKETDLFIALRSRAEESRYDDAILNGMEVFKMSNPDGNLAGPNPQLLATPGSDQAQNQTPEKSKSKKTLLAIALGSGVAGFLVLLSTVCCVVLLRLRKEKRRRSSYKRKSSRSTRGSSRRLPEQLCQRFSFSEIKSATNNFEQALEIGRGGFGNVYRGHIDDEFPEVAIKRLSKGSSRQGEREFEAEIKMLSQLRHVHLVSLIGYCDEGNEMILVYDYMANGTLRDHLYGTNNDPLSWKQRLEICVGAARGLHYLHSEVKDTIIHRDVKTTNILLDDKWVAKVADFGLSREGRGDSGAVSTAVKGTFGYMDPEYAQSRQLTDKSDVYSFGVVLFEVLCARKPVDVKLEVEQRNLARWARRCVREGKIQDIIDPFLMGKISPECFKNFVQVAEKCVRDHRNQRPTMRDVKEKLEFALELQEKADAAKQGINPDGVYVYPDLSFHLVDDHHDHGHEYDVRGPHGGTDITSTVGSDSVESSLLSVDTESGKIRDVFSDASNSKSPSIV